MESPDFGTSENRDDVSVWEFVDLWLGQHFRVSKTFGVNSD